MMELSEFDKLLNEYLSGQLNAAGARELLTMINDPVVEKQLANRLDQELRSEAYNHDQPLLQTHQRLKKGLQAAIAPAPKRIPVWLKWSAAAAVVLSVAGSVFWFIGHKPKKQLVAQQLPPSVVPGKDGAVLVLANGQQMVLDTMNNGLVTIQNGTQVRLNNGLLSYFKGHTTEPDTAYNTVYTPKGRQFHLMLPDGSHVWLNAASSLKFPTAFSGKSRQVELTGEAFLDIVTDPSRPFSIQTKQGAFTQVLGTSVNINAYPEDDDIKTTLIEGSVRAGIKQTAVILKPGEQAIAHETKAGPIAVQRVEVDKVLAWKNGFFDFNDMSFEQVMKQLARWYNLDVVYEKGIPDIQFGGKLSRNVSFDGLIKGLEKAGLHFRMRGERTLIILP